MKFKLKITKDILQKSMMCGIKVEGKLLRNVPSSCAFALALHQLVPNARVSTSYTNFYDKYHNILGKTTNSIDQQQFILKFDSLITTPELRLDLPEQEFDVEIPDVVLEHWYPDAVELSQAITNTPIFQLVC